MRHTAHAVIKTHFCKHVAATRRKYKWTKREMAEVLDMDDRSYAYIENEDSACSAVTFVLYLLFVLQEEDQLNFLSELKDLIQKNWAEIA